MCYSPSTLLQEGEERGAHFPFDPEDLWEIKMRTEEGYIYLVSPAFNCC